MDPSWESRLCDTLQTEWFKALEHKVANIREKKTVYPPSDSVYKALSLPFDDVRVVILGQDPYMNPEEAMGLSFSVPNHVKIPPSLINIFKEAKVHGVKKTGDLTGWMNQGVCS